MIIKIISDIHLDVNKLSTINAFEHYMATKAVQADKLYILGDFFHLWLGDDAMLPWHHRILDKLKKYVSNGKKLYVMYGNHDFCYGKKFAHLTGCQLIADPYIIEYNQKKLAFMHGDSLCINDRSYQRYKKIIRNPIILKILLSIPVTLRKKLANYLSSTNKKEKAAKKNHILDVCFQEVVKVMQQLGVTTLIHGHTHLPDIHNVNLPNKTVGKRYVLGDWGNDYGWDITLKQNNIELEKFKF